MVTITDLNYLLTWKNAKYLETYDECNLAQRIDEMKVMANLEIVKLNIHAYAMPEMKLSPFFYNFPRSFDLLTAPRGHFHFVWFIEFGKKDKIQKSFIFNLQK